MIGMVKPIKGGSGRSPLFVCLYASERANVTMSPTPSSTMDGR